MSLGKIAKDTVAVWQSKWQVLQLGSPPWAFKAFIWIVVIRSFSYGVELLLLVNNPISAVMAFAALLGIHIWAWLILGGLTLFLLGLILKSKVLVTAGSLVCAAVWLGFGLAVGIGAFIVGMGGRFAIAALCTAAVWVVLFILNLNNIKRNGVSHHE